MADRLNGIPLHGQPIGDGKGAQHNTPAGFAGAALSRLGKFSGAESPAHGYQVETFYMSPSVDKTQLPQMKSNFQTPGPQKKAEPSAPASAKQPAKGPVVQNLVKEQKAESKTKSTSSTGPKAQAKAMAAKTASRSHVRTVEKIGRRGNTRASGRVTTVRYLPTQRKKRKRKDPDQEQD